MNGKLWLSFTHHFMEPSYLSRDFGLAHTGHTYIFGVKLLSVSTYQLAEAVCFYEPGLSD